MKRLSLAALTVLLAACGGGNPPTIELFTAVPSSIALGDSTQLLFAAESGSTLSIDQGVGDVTGKTSVTVSPTFPFGETYPGWSGPLPERKRRLPTMTPLT